ALWGAPLGVSQLAKSRPRSFPPGRPFMRANMSANDPTQTWRGSLPGEKPALDRPNVKTTPLHSLHVEFGARMMALAGYEMPLHYPLGVLKEHLHPRTAAGLFDISHMGQIALYPRSGHVADAALALERLAPSDIVSLEPGRQRYSLLTSEDGGILDDVMAANRGDYLLLVVN